MLPQLNRQKPTPRSRSHFMLGKKGSRNGYSIFNPTNSLLHCFSPSFPPHLNADWCVHWVVRVPQYLRRQAGIPAILHLLMKALFFDTTQSEDVTGSHHPASPYWVSVCNTSMYLSVRIKGDWNSYPPWKSGRKVLAQCQAVHEMAGSPLQLKRFGSWM